MEDISVNSWSKIRYLRIYKSKPSERVDSYSIYANGRACLPVYIKIGFEDYLGNPAYPDKSSILRSLYFYSFDGNSIGSVIWNAPDYAPKVEGVNLLKWVSSPFSRGFDYNEGIVASSLQLRCDISELLQRKYSDSTTPSSFSLSDYRHRDEDGNVVIESPTSPEHGWNAAYFEDAFTYSEKFGLPSYMPFQARRTATYEGRDEHAKQPNIIDDIQTYLRHRTETEASDGTFDVNRWHRVDELTGDEIVLSESSPGTCWEKDFFLGMLNYAETKGLPWYTGDMPTTLALKDSGLRAIHWATEDETPPPNILTDVKHVLQIKRSAEEFGSRWTDLLRIYLEAIENDMPVPSTTHPSITWDPEFFLLLLNYVDRHGLLPYYPTLRSYVAEEPENDNNNHPSDHHDVGTHAFRSELTKRDNHAQDMPDTGMTDDDFGFSYDNEGRCTLRYYIYTSELTANKKIIVGIDQSSGDLAHTGHDNPSDDGWGKSNGRDDRKFSSWIEVRAVSPHAPPVTSLEWGNKLPGSTRDLAYRKIGGGNSDKRWYQMEITLTYHSKYAVKWMSTIENKINSRSIWKDSGKDGGQEWALNFIAQPGEKNWVIPLDRYGPRRLKGDSYHKGWIDLVIKDIIGDALPIDGANSSSAAYQVFIGHLEGEKNWKIVDYWESNVNDSIRMTLNLIDSQGTDQTIELVMNRVDLVTLN